MQTRKWMLLALSGLACCVVAGVLVANALAEPAVDGALAIARVMPAAGATYIGASKCRSCHSKEYKVWRKTKHAKNFETLQGDEKKNPDCIQCHTTGYGQGGFVSEEKTPNLTNVGCESCHGPGSLHAEAAKDAPEEGEWKDTKYEKYKKDVCVGCHKPHIDQKKHVEKLRAG